MICRNIYIVARITCQSLYAKPEGMKKRTTQVLIAKAVARIPPQSTRRRF